MEPNGTLPRSSSKGGPGMDKLRKDPNGDSGSGQSQSETTRKRKNKNQALLRVLMGVILIAVAAGAWVFWLSPPARVRRTVNDMAAAFQAKDLNRLMGHFSERYLDDGGNTRAQMQTVAQLIFGKTQRIRVEMKQMKVYVQGDRAAASITGRILFYYNNIPYKTDYNETPFVLYLNRENGKWRTTKINDVDTSLSDLDYITREAKESL